MNRIFLVFRFCYNMLEIDNHYQKAGKLNTVISVPQSLALKHVIRKEKMVGSAKRLRQ